MRISRLVAWTTAVISIGLIASSLVLDEVASRGGVPGAGSSWLYPFLFVAVAPPAVVGATLVARGGGARIGWILVFGGLSVAVPLTAQPYAEVALIVHPGSLPAGAWAGLISDASGRGR